MDAIQPSSAFPRLQTALQPWGGASGRDATPPSSGLPTASGSLAVGDFDAMVYRSQMQRTSLMLQYSEAAARAATTADGATQAEAYAQQLEFSFAAESRTEELALFRQRTTAVADGLSETQRTQFLGVSRSLAFRFRLSVKLSGSALQSFAGAAESLKSTGDASLDKFIALARKIFAKDDKSLADLLHMLEKGIRGSGDPEKRLQKFLDRLASLNSLSDGVAASAQSFQLEFEFSFESSEVRIEQATVQQADPLVLDLDDDGIELTDHTQGALFDIAGTGAVVRTAFVNGGDAFLALDRNGNGRIDHGGELFGDQRGAANGFEELRRLDSNGDGTLDASDAEFSRLLLFRDNGNGVSEAGELVGLSEAGIAALNLAYANVNEAAAGGNRLAQAATYRRNNGTTGRAGDALLNFTA